MTTKKGHVEVPLETSEARLIAREILILDLMTKPVPTILSPIPKWQSMRPLVRLLRLPARRHRKSIEIPRDYVLRFIHATEVALYRGVLLPTIVGDFANRCRDAIRRVGRRPLTGEQLHARVKAEFIDERQHRRLIQRQRLTRWYDEQCKQGKTLLTAELPPKKWPRELDK